ncbi:zona pellucida sperm-binding protein 3-like [Brachionichthys hirsutus]|uniref:zona pellucida sperm-binding protein 3-like n=1 Tax=Brachionichthys hirsutus TaxID=412623 RepID=UPI0036047846
MDARRSWVNLLLLFGVCVGSSFAFPPRYYTQHAFLKRPQVPKRTLNAPAEAPEQMNAVHVSCNPHSMEIAIKADLFGVGAPVDGDELNLGVELSDVCRATASSADEYKIVAGLVDCGTRHWMTKDSLVYTNLLIYAPVASPDGLIRMDRAVIPIECHYQRKYNLSSSSLVPSWVPFMSTQAAEETLAFGLSVKTNDWLYERRSNVFRLGERIAVEASIRTGRHTGLRVFLSSCVATLDPDVESVPGYVFVKNGCLVDSRFPDSRSHFVSRTQDDKLRLVVDAFRFNNDDRGELYVACLLTAVPVNDAQAPNKACTFINGRWRSADGNDYLCGQCQSQNEDGYPTHSKPSSPAKVSPRGFGKPPQSEGFWRSGYKTGSGWNREARLGPMLFLPSEQRSRPLPVEALPPVLGESSAPVPYGSQWRGGAGKLPDLEERLRPGAQAAPEQVEVQTSGQSEDIEGDGPEDGDAESGEAAPLITAESQEVAPDGNITATLHDVGTASPSKSGVTTMSNETGTEAGLSDTNDPKR